MTRILLVLALILHICFADYSKYQLDTFKDISMQCYRNLGIPEDSDILQRIEYNRNITEDPLIKEFLLCGQKLLGWIDTDGNFQNETIIRFFSDRYDAEQVKEVVELCVLSGGETVLDKVYNFHQCYFKHKKYAL
ncbi:uncharacterized protein LOC110675217 [Aedes aegypti]|uniref:Uncharacterized protein n=1 Tax=Aedes aegypti TaxID=7159 RepID=A0A6I8U877_AEDAE|nr:uncharacterized protein LOC110675217 [Aedes aegypti]